MLFRSFIACTALLLSTFTLEAGVWDKVVDTIKGKEKTQPPTINVLLVHDIESANLEVKGRYSLFDPYTNSYISSRFIGKSKQIQALNSGLKWGEMFPGLYQLHIKPDQPETVTVIDGREYPDSLFIYDVGGAISFVNRVSVEEYVKSIISSYESQDLHTETLAALSIVARTNAYFQAVNPKNTYWAVDAKKVHYEGRVLGIPAVTDAVELTKYMIMSNTGVYEGVATPFPAQFDTLTPSGILTADLVISKVSLEEANQMAKGGAHAAQILSKAFPNTTIMLMQYSAN